jgi:hypothetical protein
MVGGERVEEDKHEPVRCRRSQRALAEIQHVLRSRLRRTWSIEIKEVYDDATDLAHNNIDTRKASQMTLISRHYNPDP